MEYELFAVKAFPEEALVTPPVEPDTITPTP
jgi:hypothetical protein